ncbi:G patch domain-containing protein 4 [Trichomycterus rosablanca]|uniref:G patch domain-containing protein 4 n=1 Tax=Trichomycterus rosablanca TaxID=2290929 RepID=UPI002F356805
MAGASDLNNCGTKFAEQQLLRHGWKQGKGLGRNENGISEAIRVKVKCDKGGIGHKESEQFTFHWWDHVFNKASAGLVVESAQNGVMVKKVDEGEEGVISNKKPRKALLDKSALYGNFVKSATLLSGQERPERSSSSSDDSSSDDDEKLDLSSTKKLSDAELMKVCGGRTAHKGARHGLKMSAKLARLEQQEQEFMEKYGKKSQRDKTTSPSEAVPTEPCPASDQEAVHKTKKKKAKKEKRKQHADELQENGVQMEGDDINPEALQNHSDKETSKKKTKCLKDRAESEDCVDAFGDVSEAERLVSKKKKKQKRVDQVAAGGDEADGCCPTHEPDSENVTKKERKKAKKRSKDVSFEAQVSEDCPEATENGDGVSKRKNKKSSKHKDDQSSNTETNVLEPLEETMETASSEIEKSKSKKRKKSSREEQMEETEHQSIEPIKKKKKKKHEK